MKKLAARTVAEGLECEVRQQIGDGRRRTYGLPVREPSPHSSPKAVGDRLRELRESYGLQSKTAWSTSVGITLSAWSNYESGYSRISLDQALRVVIKTGASLDWIYRGTGKLPPRLNSARSPSRRQHLS